MGHNVIIIIRSPQLTLSPDVTDIASSRRNPTTSPTIK